MSAWVPSVRVVDVVSGRKHHVGRVLGVLAHTIEVEGPRGTRWYFRRRDGRGVGAVDDLRLDAGVFYVDEG